VYTFNAKFHQNLFSSFKDNISGWTEGWIHVAIPSDVHFIHFM